MIDIGVQVQSIHNNQKLRRDRRQEEKNQAVTAEWRWNPSNLLGILLFCQKWWKRMHCYLGKKSFQTEHKASPGIPVFSRAGKKGENRGWVEKRTVVPSPALTEAQQHRNDMVNAYGVGKNASAAARDRASNGKCCWHVGLHCSVRCALVWLTNESSRCLAQRAGHQLLSLSCWLVTTNNDNVKFNDGHCMVNFLRENDRLHLRCNFMDPFFFWSQVTLSGNITLCFRTRTGICVVQFTVSKLRHWNTVYDLRRSKFGYAYPCPGNEKLAWHFCLAKGPRGLEVTSIWPSAAARKRGVGEASKISHWLYLIDKNFVLLISNASIPPISNSIFFSNIHLQLSNWKFYQL